LLTDGQVPLAGSYKAVHATNAKWWRELLGRALVSNGVSANRIAQETEREPSAVSRMLSGEQGLAADVVVAILANDALGVVLGGMSERLGFEPPRRKTPDLAEENRQLREQLARARAALGDP
jgi:hypothetical protein